MVCFWFTFKSYLRFREHFDDETGETNTDCWWDANRASRVNHAEPSKTTNANSSLKKKAEDNRANLANLQRLCWLGITAERGHPGTVSTLIQRRVLHYRDCLNKRLAVQWKQILSYLLTSQLETCTQASVSKSFMPRGILVLWEYDVIQEGIFNHHLKCLPSTLRMICSL